MGIYQKLGIRKIAIYILEFITWTRHYGFKDGFCIFRNLEKQKDSFYKIKTSFFKNPVWLRDNYSDKAIFKQVFFETQYDLTHITSINASRIIDAGANIGLASIYFSIAYPNSQVISIEPDSNNFEILRKNIAGHKNISSLKAAVWNRNEMVSITNPNSLAASFMVEKTEANAIQAVTLDQILHENNWDSVDIVKMDIEGAEKEVFSGSLDWLRKTKLLIIELHDRYKPECTKTFFRALESFDYSAFFQHENIFILFNQSQE